MPTAKKTIKLRDQKPLKDPVGGRKGGPRGKHLNSAGTEGSENQRRRGRHNRF